MSDTDKSVEDEAEKTPEATPEAGGEGAAQAEALPDGDAAPDPSPEGAPDDTDAHAITDHTGKDRTRGGAFGAILGGIVAAVIGFAFAWFVAPDGWPIDTQKQAIAALEDRLASGEAEQEKLLQSQVSLTMRLSRAEGGLARVQDALAPVEEGVKSLSAGLSDLHARLGQLEARPVVETTPDVGAEIAQALTGYEEEVAGLKAEVVAQAQRAADLSARFDTLSAELADRVSGAETLATEAKQVERAVLAQGALAALGRAILSGGPFDDALSDLTNAAGVPAPPVLRSAASDGIPTLSALQDAFPAAARAALAASVQLDPSANVLDRLGTFLKVQTGARSLTPKEGQDPDAVLSRAEAALKEGRVRDALDLIATLPKEGQEAMADWTRTALTHADALAAFDTLTSTLSPNPN